MKRTISISGLLIITGCFCFSQIPFRRFHYLETAGIVSIEAEHFTDFRGPWEQVEGRTARTFEMRGYGEWYDSIFLLDRGDSVVFPGGTERLRWALPGEQAKILAWLTTGKEKALAFFYRKEDPMPSGKAPDFRAGLFIPGGSPGEIPLQWMSYLLQESGANGREVLMLTGNVPPEGRDIRIREILETCGFTVRFLAARDLHDSLLHGAVIVVGETARNEHLEGKLEHLELPVIVCKHNFTPLMGMVIVQPETEPERGQFPNAMLNRAGRAGDYLEYRTRFQHPGSYRLHILGKGQGFGCNFFRVEMRSVKSAGSLSSVVVCFRDQRNGWTSPGECLHCGQAGLSELNVPEAGCYDLRVYRGAFSGDTGAVDPRNLYPGWRMDKIILSAEVVAIPGEVGLIPGESFSIRGDGPPETTDTLSCSPCRPPEEQIPERVFMTGKKNYLVIEAEEMDHSTAWKLTTEPEGFTGSGYLVWAGTDRTVSVEGTGGNLDQHFIRQGPMDDWLILPVVSEDSGLFHLDIRNYHRLKDGDNDLWINPFHNQPYHPGFLPVKRVTDGHKDGTGFTWLDWAPARITLQRGLNLFYLSGRSAGFGIDRIAIYKPDDREGMIKALDPATAPDQMVRSKL